MGENNSQSGGGPGEAARRGRPAKPVAADAAAETPAGEGPEGAGPQAKPTLKCPFCSGKRFDFGRDIYAGPEPLLYCRKAPRPGRAPEKGFSIPMKGAVCLDCGYVAMMVDVNQLNTPISRPTDPAAVLAHFAGAAGHLAREPEDAAAEALGKMTAAGPVDALAPGEPQAPEAPASPKPDGDVDFRDLASLLERAEKGLGPDRKRTDG